MNSNESVLNGDFVSSYSLSVYRVISSIKGDCVTVVLNSCYGGLNQCRISNKFESGQE
jgi:hypothetical protein